MSNNSNNKNKDNSPKNQNRNSPGDTFYDSCHNINKTEDLNNQKEQNFFLALQYINAPNINNGYLSISEFAEINPNQTKEENVSKYLHHPIIKEINKNGNDLIRVKPKQNYESRINLPYTSECNDMKNMIKNIYKEIKEGNVNNEGYNLKTIKNEKSSGIMTINKKISQSNKLFLENKNNYSNGYNNKSDQINSTTMTKAKFSKNNQCRKKELNLKKKCHNLEDLEEPIDIDLNKYKTSYNKERNNINLNELIEENNNSISTQKDNILVIDSFIDKNQMKSDIDYSNTLTGKKLRKKYERTEFKKYIHNTNPKINKYIILYGNNDEFINRKINGNDNIIKITKNKINDFIFCDNKKSSNNNSLDINKNLLNNFNDCFSSKKVTGRNRKNEIMMNVSKNESSLQLIDIVTINEDNNNNFNNINISKENNIINKNTSNGTIIVKDGTMIDSNSENINYYINKDSTSSPKYDLKLNFPLTQHAKNSCESRDFESCKYIFDFISPEKNPEVIKRENFSLKCFPKKSTKSSSNIDKINLSKFSEKNIKKTPKIKNNNTIFSSNSPSMPNGNISYIKYSNHKTNIMNIEQGDTIYDLNFYKNLISNGAKVKKIKYENILKNHKNIKWEDRVHTLIWMMKICEEFAFKRDTFHYACNYFDNYLTFGKETIADKKILELIGITCISISGKIEEIQIPKLEEYSNSIDTSFNVKDIIEMEKKICLALGWKLINVNINIWLNWYICQWDLFIDSVDDIKQNILKYINEDKIIYYKRANDISYYNYRKISQLIDIIALDHYSYKYEPRMLMAGCLFIIICINYNFVYDFKRKNFKQKNKLGKFILKVYIKFISQSFDYEFNDEEFQKVLAYCYQFKNFNFNYDLPLLYQIHPELLENGSYEDFISYQTTNIELENYLNDIIISRTNKIKNISEKTTSSTEMNKNKPSSFKKIKNKKKV